MGHVDKALSTYRVDARQLPSVLMAILAVASLIAIVGLRRDLSVLVGLPAWFVISSLQSGLSLWALIRLSRPAPLLEVDLRGIWIPGIIKGPVAWTAIRSFDVETSRGRLGDHNDHLVIHFNSPITIDWTDRKRRRMLRNIPQAAISIPIGASWPARAEDIRKRVIETAAFISDQRVEQTIVSLPSTRPMRVTKGAAALLSALLVPFIFYMFDVGFPRQFAVGLDLYERGDVTAALPILEADGRAGDRASAYVVGEIYLNGDGVERNLALSTAWFRRSAEARHADAAFRLGEAHRLGLGTPPSIENAIEWLSIAANRGVSDAAYSLSRIYRLGDGVRRDYVVAVSWLRRAADAGYPAAQHDLGRLYFDGLGVEQDKGRAIRWYAEAAERGYLPARYDLAAVLLDGDIGDRRAGIEHLIAAAHGGYGPAQRRLARHYLSGQDVQLDPVAAYKWISLATRAWPTETRSELVREKVRIGGYLTDEEISRAMAHIRAWRPRRS